jgi:ribosomal protein S24E
MEIKIASKKENRLLKRSEVVFNIEHAQGGGGSTPPRLEVRKALANLLKTDAELVFIKKLETKTGTHTALGVAHVYDSAEQSKLIEPEYIIKRHAPPAKQEVKEEK